MERRKFIKNCCYSAIGISVIGTSLLSCDAIYYATYKKEPKRYVVPKTEFIKIKKDKEVQRKFIFIKEDNFKFSLCLYKIAENKYTASLMRCTHKSCELNVGGGIYSCPCHGSEFSVTGEVLNGPAEENLKTYKTETDNENIYIYFS